MAVNMQQGPAGSPVGGQVAIDVPSSWLGDEDQRASLALTLGAALSEDEARVDLKSLCQEIDQLSAAQEVTEQLLAPLAMDEIAAIEMGDDRQAKLQAYLRKIYPNAPSLRVTRLNAYAAGRSKFTAAVEIEACEELPANLVFRQDTALNAAGGGSIANEHAVMTCLSDLGLLVPRPLWLEQESTELGLPFYIMTRAEGRPAAEGMHPPKSAKVVRELARQMARLHRVPLEQVRGFVAAEPIPDKEMLRAQIDEFALKWKASDRPSQTMTYALHWLRENVELAFAGPRALLHRDLMFHNVLADGDELTALLDWEFATIGYAAEDLGWTRPVAQAVIPWSEFLDIYVQAGGPNLDPRHLNFYAIWSAVRLGAMLAQVNNMVATGATTNIEYVCGSFHETQILLNRLGELIKGLLEKS